MQNCAILGRSISFNINKLTISDMLGVRVVARSNRVAPTNHFSVKARIGM